MGQRKNERAFSLIESAIVLGIVGLVIGGIWIAAAEVSKKYKINETINGIFTIVHNIQNLLTISDAQQIGHNVDITSIILSSSAIPKDWVGSNNIINPFGGKSYIYNFSDIYGNRFDVRLYDIPQQACIWIVFRVASIGASAGSQGDGSFERPALSHISVDRTGADLTTGGWYTTTFPVSMADATTACALTSNWIAITFGYSRIN